MKKKAVPPRRTAAPRWLPPVLLVLALGAGVAIAVILGQWGTHAPRTMVATVFDPPHPVPGFTLVAQDGSGFDAGRLRGRYTLLFFGYTNCPDVCPTTLLELARARRLLGALPPGQQLQVAMITVDPARDTPERLTAYVAHFDPTFIGLTGTVAAVDALARALGVVIERGVPRDGAYGVDHSANVYLIGPDARLLAEFPAPHRATTVASDLHAILGSSAR